MDPSFKQIVEVIGRSDADLVALQEVDVHCPRTDYRHQPEELATALGYEWHFFPLVDWSNEAHRRETEGTYGLSYLSRRNLSITSVQKHFLPRLHLSAEQRGLFQIDIDFNSQNIPILNTHLSHKKKEQAAQMEFIRQQLSTCAARGQDYILAGDFNCINLRGFRKFLEVNAHECIPTSRVKTTFPSAVPLLRLDRIFVSDGLAYSSCQIDFSKTARFASDHLPVLAEIVFSK